MELPPAQKAFIWYPYAESPEFSDARFQEGVTQWLVPCFYKDDYAVGPHSFPAEFDGRLFYL